MFGTSSVFSWLLSLELPKDSERSYAEFKKESLECHLKHLAIFILDCTLAMNKIDTKHLGSNLNQTPNFEICLISLDTSLQSMSNLITFYI